MTENEQPQTPEVEGLRRIDKLATDLVLAINDVTEAAGLDERQLRAIYHKGLSVNRVVSDATLSIGHRWYVANEKNSRAALQEKVEEQLKAMQREREQ